MTEHTVKAFGEELDALSALLSRMGGFSESMVADAVASVARRDTSLAQGVIGRDGRIDEMERDVEKQIVRLLALRQPMARDLREVLAAYRLSLEIERIGDLAKNIAKRALILNQADPVSLTRSVERMGKIVSSRLKDVLDAYGTRDMKGALTVWGGDEDVDEHYNSLFRELLTYMMADPRMITSCAHLLFVAKNMERIGDHCTNMAEIVHFLVTGEDMPNDRPKIDSLSQG
ncbi:MAG: phosphate signaling complex protein PhoU [Caulobacterales bacterium]